MHRAAAGRGGECRRHRRPARGGAAAGRRSCATAPRARCRRRSCAARPRARRRGDRRSAYACRQPRRRRGRGDAQRRSRSSTPRSSCSAMTHLTEEWRRALQRLVERCRRSRRSSARLAVRRLLRPTRASRDEATARRHFSRALSPADAAEGRRPVARRLPRRRAPRSSCTTRRLLGLIDGWLVAQRGEGFHRAAADAAPRLRRASTRVERRRLLDARSRKRPSGERPAARRRRAPTSAGLRSRAALLLNDSGDRARE